MERHAAQDATCDSAKAKRPMPVLEVGDPDMSSGNMSISELTQAVRQFQALQLAHAVRMPAMKNAVDDHASSLEVTSKEISTIHRAYT